MVSRAILAAYSSISPLTHFLLDEIGELKRSNGTLEMSYHQLSTCW
jgi:hypothetical protein